MSDENLKLYLRAAVIEHLRWWLKGDGLHFRRFRSTSEVDPKTLRAIAVDYYVSRGLLKGKHCQIAKLIEGELRNWPQKLPERAAFVCRMATLARDKKLTHGVQLSAFSKFMWFLRPEGWTLYDKWAQKGLARPQSSIRFMDYYQRLEQMQFLQVTCAMREVVSGSAFPSLWPERIFDKYLMLCGQRSISRHSQDGAPQDGFIAPGTHHDYLEVLGQFFGPKLSANVEALTERLLDVVADKELFQAHFR